LKPRKPFFVRHRNEDVEELNAAGNVLSSMPPIQFLGETPLPRDRDPGS
jgi:hypothetical protein